MAVLAGQEIEVSIEKPAAGGRMIARHDGQVILVAGAIPGERVSARVERVEKRLAFASAVAVLESSSDRRRTASDPLCGGCVYAHINYARQVALKSEIIHDAFSRIGRIPIEAAVPVVSSAENGYRMRARLHVRGRSAGFYREGTHQLCDASATRQLLPESIRAVEAALAALHDADADVVSVELSENAPADERALHADVNGEGGALEDALAKAVAAAGLTGCTARTAAGRLIESGNPDVSDSLATLTRGRVPSGELRRRPASFFQGNRFVIPDMVVTVLDAVPPEGDVLDLYAGVGLFSISLAATGRARITAVEGDRDSASDLQRNAGAYSGQLRAVVGRVEELAIRRGPAAETIIVDPPRTGISREAMEAIARHGASRIVYVSCDPPTMARDARRLLDAGYRVASLKGFDFFPNTPHVETVGVFDK